MDNLSFEGLEVNSPEYKRVANRRFYDRNKEAEKARSKKWRQENPQKYAAWAEKNKEKRQAHSRKYEYNMSQEDFDRKMIEQDGNCAICKQPLVRPDVDHNHSCCPDRRSCGKCTRGILCHTCNTIIGLAQDSIEVLGNAILYLKEYDNGSRQQNRHGIGTP